MTHLDKYLKSWRGVVFILLISALPLAVNAAGGIEDYVPYVVLLILLLTFALAFINFRNIRYERKLLEEERSELANQRLRMDEDLVREKSDLVQERERLEKDLNAIKKGLEEDRKLLQKAMEIIEEQLTQKNKEGDTSADTGSGRNNQRTNR